MTYYLKQDNQIVKVRDFRDTTYPLRSFYGSATLFVRTDSIDYDMPCAIDDMDLKYPSPEAEEFYAMWRFKDGSAAIQRRKDKGFRFVSEMWELKDAARRLGLELILDN